MQSVMQHVFSMIPQADIPRSVFNRSHGYKTTFDAGYLIPFYVDHALPGDTFRLNTTIFARLATPVVPLMDNLVMDTFYFAVPYRLVWNNFQKFCGEQTDPGDSTDYYIPQLQMNSARSEQSLTDYMGIPPDPISISVNALPTRAYNLIYNEWFRDQNLIDSAVVDKDDGPDSPSDYVIRRRGKRHDYFTSCLPWPQKGDAVEINIGDEAPVYGNGMALGLKNNQSFGMYNTSGGQLGAATQAYNTAINTYVGTKTAPDYDKTIGVVTSGESGLIADLSSATAITINDLREAFQVQRLLERDARGGTRYTEIIRSHFGVLSPDARLQRPEYLGGSSSRIIVNPVQQTSSTDATSPQGNLAAYGLVSDSKGGFSKSFTEHSVIIGLVCVRADLTYQQGVNREWWKKSRYDLYWPALAHLGEQAVFTKEIYTQAGDGWGGSSDQTVFGYQERYAEYRYKPSLITGKMRSSSAASLDVWHLSQEFGSAPTLNQTFIEENPPMSRVIAVPSEPHFIFDSFIDLNCARPMPVYSVPGLIDHF